MKKRTIAAALALCVLLSGAALAAGGDKSDPLISLNYLNGTYWSSLETLVDSAVKEDTQPIYDAALAKAGQQSPSGQTVSNGFTAQTGGTGGVVKLTLGSGILWTDGGGRVRAGLLVDATTGQEAAPGTVLAAGHRYLAAEDASVLVTTQSAGWLVEGVWTAFPATGLAFTDVAADTWYCDPVRYAVEKGLFKGVTDTTFEPSGTMTRGMAATVLYRIAGEPAAAYAPLFSDVPEDRWYTSAVVWAGQNQIDAGKDGAFRPKESITREELASMLYQYASLVGADAAGSGLDSFSDAGDVSAWARDAMAWAVQKEIMQGSGGLLRPGASASRAEVAAMFQRFQTWLEA